MEYPISFWEKVQPEVLVERAAGILSPMYREITSGEEQPRHLLPPGAIIKSLGRKRGLDGESLLCMVPFNNPKYSDKTTEWNIDGRASNCTMRDDDQHHCWIRHGSFGDYDLHVYKIGNTCAAGAGSIAVDGFHGFLHHGRLRDC